MQKFNYMAAEVVYKKAQMIDSDANKAWNLALCLIKEARYTEAHSVLNEVLQGKIPGSKDCKAQNRAQELMLEVCAMDDVEVCEAWSWRWFYWWAWEGVEWMGSIENKEAPNQAN